MADAAPQPVPANQVDRPSANLGQTLLWATIATLGVSGLAAAVLGGLSGVLLYQYARARGVWGTDEPPEGMAEEVSFPSQADSVRICGWFLPATQIPAPSVVLCHGVWTGRRECLPLALKFHNAGYNVLCFDFRAHGMSEGRFTSVGHHETNDVIGAVQYLKTRPEVDPARIGVMGFSMGAAATIQAAARCEDIAAVVADSSYSAFMDAVRYSFRGVVGGLPPYPFASIANAWARWLVNVDANQLRPIDVVDRIAPRPIFFTHGQEDEIVPVQHADLLYAAAGGPKELWIVPESRHVGARDDRPDEYFERVEAFLRQSLSGPARAA